MVRPRSDIEARILDAARARFLAEGVDGASLRAVAKDAGTSIGMIYYYHPTKDALFLAVVERVYLALLTDLETALDNGLNVEERLERLYARLAALTADELLVVRLVLREALTSSSRLDRLIARFRRGHIPLLVQLVQDGVKTGVLAPDLPPLLLVAVLGAIGGPAQLMMRALASKAGLPGADVSPRQLVQVLLNGIGGQR
jgi:TetR/AcrR family transcriptional regulator